MVEKDAPECAYLQDLALACTSILELRQSDPEPADGAPREFIRDRNDRGHTPLREIGAQPESVGEVIESCVAVVVGENLSQFGGPELMIQRLFDHRPDLACFPRHQRGVGVGDETTRCGVLELLRGNIDGQWHEQRRSEPAGRTRSRKGPEKEWNGCCGHSHG